MQTSPHRAIVLADAGLDPRHESLIHTLEFWGHKVYDYKNPGPKVKGMVWDDEDPLYHKWSNYQLRDAVYRAKVQKQVRYDLQAIEQCDTFLLVSPSEYCSHIGLGIAWQQGKDCVIYMPDKPVLTVLYGIVHAIACSQEELFDYLSYPIGQIQREG